MLRSGSIALGAAAILAACQPVPATTTTMVVAVDPTVNVSEATTVTASRALELFAAVCGSSLPNFQNAPSLMARVGATENASTGTVFSPTEDVSFRILEGPGSGKSCSFVFATHESQNSVHSTYRQHFGEIRPSPLGNFAAYPGSNTIVLIGGLNRGGDGLNYFNLRLLSER